MKKQEVTKSDQKNSNGNGEKSDDAIEYPSNSHIRIEDINTAIENLVEQETPIGEKSRIEREKRDLQAQESMSSYTRYMFWAGIMGLILTAVGIYFIWRTFDQTKKAIVVATSSNVAAEKAADAAWAAVNSDRPWLMFTPKGDGSTRQSNFSYTSEYDYGGERGIVNFSDGAWVNINVKNFGKIPAQSLMFSADTVVVEAENFDGFANPPKIKSRSFVPPDGFMFSPILPISKSDKDDFLKGRKNWYVYYRVLYKGVNKDAQYESEYCFQVKRFGDSTICVPKGEQNRII